MTWRFEPTGDSSVIVDQNERKAEVGLTIIGQTNEAATMRLDPGQAEILGRVLLDAAARMRRLEHERQKPEET